ncbi:hypothetical protein ACQKFU_11770 [Bacillus mycoides]|uniref:hypothetical protein n=1 Tax=Bacillus mycoides TaxID=1405 RepID=UPI003D02A261
MKATTTTIQIETNKKQVNYKEIARRMDSIHVRYGNDITVKFKADNTYTVTPNSKGE